MFAIVAAVLFIIGFIINGTETSTSNHWLSGTSLELLGLFFLAVHFIHYVYFTNRRVP